MIDNPKLIDIIQQASSVHNNKYDYSKSIYINSRSQIEIICPEHGSFFKRKYEHLQGQGCPKCSSLEGSIRKSLGTSGFIEKAQQIHGDKFDYSKVNYVNSRFRVSIICPSHGPFEQLPFIHFNSKYGCPRCGQESTGNQLRGDLETFIEKSNKIHLYKYDYKLAQFNNLGDKIIIICPIHGEFEQEAKGHLNGCGCFLCGVDKRRKTKEQFILEAKEIHGDKYDYINVNYKNNSTDIEIICSKHGIFLQSPAVHLEGYGCQKCGNEAQTKTQEQFLLEARATHGNRYDYSKSHYINWKTELEIICREHGLFQQQAGAHIQGRGCYFCGIESSRNAKIKSNEQFLYDASSIHFNTYDYSLVNYIGIDSKITIICRKHGAFDQSPSVHLAGHGCNQCAIEKNADLCRLGNEEFILRASEVHNCKYNYSETEYRHLEQVVKIICPDHGLFLQRPDSHLNGSNCPSCASIQRSLNAQEKPTGWHYTTWQEAGEKSERFDSYKVYILECWNEKERFFKIGKTFVKIEQRFKNKFDLPYNWKTIKIIERDARYISILERKLQKRYIKYKYTPFIEFPGMSECFSQINL